MAVEILLVLLVLVAQVEEATVQILHKLLHQEQLILEVDLELVVLTVEEH